MNRLLFFIFASLLIEGIQLSGTFGQDHGRERGRERGRGRGRDRGHGPECCNVSPSASQMQKHAEFEKIAQACRVEIGKDS